MPLTCIDFLEKLSPKSRAEAWKIFTHLCKIIQFRRKNDLSPDNISYLKNEASEFNKILRSESLSPYFDENLSDEDFTSMLESELSKVSERKHNPD